MDVCPDIQHQRHLFLPSPLSPPLPDGKNGVRENKSGNNLLLLADPLTCPVEAVGADEAYSEEVVGRTETPRGQVALESGGVSCGVSYYRC